LDVAAPVVVVDLADVAAPVVVVDVVRVVAVIAVVRAPKSRPKLTTKKRISKSRASRV
jgi:hypothetical protein